MFDSVDARGPLSIDGELKAVVGNYNGRPTRLMPSDDPLRVGVELQNDWQCFDGMIDAVHVYYRALQGPTLCRLAKRQRPTTGPTSTALPRASAIGVTAVITGVPLTAQVHL